MVTNKLPLVVIATDRLWTQDPSKNKQCWISDRPSSHIITTNVKNIGPRERTRREITTAMATTNLPVIQHPLSRTDGPMNFDVRGVSREGSRGGPSRQSLNFGANLEDRNKMNAFRPITADQVSWRLAKSVHGGNQTSPRDRAVPLGNIPEGVEVRRSQDPTKPTMPIFGKGYSFNRLSVVESDKTFGK